MMTCQITTSPNPTKICPKQPLKTSPCQPGFALARYQSGLSPAQTAAGFRYNAAITDRIRIIKHEAAPQCGSFEVRFDDGRRSKYFYWDDLPGRRMRPEILTREAALEAAKTLARGRSGRRAVKRLPALVYVP
jgi:hypothetical protein